MHKSVFHDDIYVNYLNSIRPYDPLSPEEEIAICIKVQEGDKKAREKLINHNLRLVVRIATSYSKYYDIMDAISIGNIALIKAVDSFDPYKGFRFATFAYHYIDGVIKSRLLPHLFQTRLPAHATWEYLNFRKIYENLKETKKNLSVDDLVKATGYPLQKVMSYISIYNGTLSLNQFINEEQDELNDVVCDPNNIIAETENKLALDSLLEQIFKKMKPREVLFVKMHYGIGEARTYTLQEIGDKHGISRERVRQIIERAFKRIAQNENLKNQFAVILAD